MKLSEARRKKGLTGREFAKRLAPFFPVLKGTQRSEESLFSIVSRWETGRRPVPQEIRGKIMEILDCEINFDINPPCELLDRLKLSEEDRQLILNNPALHEPISAMLTEYCKKVRGSLQLQQPCP